MKKYFIAILFCFSMLTGCLSGKKQSISRIGDFAVEKLTLIDSLRNRIIPIAVYAPKIDHHAVVIFSHGYGQNKGGDYLHYSYLTEYLASKGFLVVSIQHELPTDSLIPSLGIP